MDEVVVDMSTKQLQLSMHYQRESLFFYPKEAYCRTIDTEMMSFPADQEYRRRPHLMQRQGARLPDAGFPVLQIRRGSVGRWADSLKFLVWVFLK